MFLVAPDERDRTAGAERGRTHSSGGGTAGAEQQDPRPPHVPPVLHADEGGGRDQRQQGGWPRRVLRVETVGSGETLLRSQYVLNVRT